MSVWGRGRPCSQGQVGHPPLGPTLATPQSSPGSGHQVGHPAPCTSPPCPKGGCLTFLTQAAPVAGEAEADKGIDFIDAGATILAGAGQAVVHVCGVQGTGQTAGPHGTRKPAQDRTTLQEDCKDTVGLTRSGVGELSLP